MRETVLEFGPAGRLSGVLCQPLGPAGPFPVCIVITNSGIIHRVGANRLHVRLARRLAQEGYPSLRYDLPGIGESETLGIGPDLVQEQLAGTRLAIDALERLGVARTFVMLGLCSGAGHSLAAAVSDRRITGAVLIDPPVMVATRRHRFQLLVRAALRGLRPRVWWRMLRGRYELKRMIAERAIEPARPGMPVSLPNSPDHDLRRQAASALRAIVERRVSLWLLVTGHNRDVYSYRRQLFDAFPELPGLEALTRIDVWPAAGHTFGSEAERSRLEQHLLEWLRTAAPGALEPASNAAHAAPGGRPAEALGALR